jgi:hypothetical protein
VAKAGQKPNKGAAAADAAEAVVPDFFRRLDHKFQTANTSKYATLSFISPSYDLFLEKGTTRPNKPPAGGREGRGGEGRARNTLQPKSCKNNNADDEQKIEKIHSAPSDRPHWSLLQAGG